MMVFSPYYTNAALGDNTFGGPHPFGPSSLSSLMVAHTINLDRD